MSATAVGLELTAIRAPRGARLRIGRAGNRHQWSTAREPALATTFLCSGEAINVAARP
jgi:hypothetical protein